MSFVDVLPTLPVIPNKNPLKKLLLRLAIFKKASLVFLTTICGKFATSFSVIAKAAPFLKAKGTKSWPLKFFPIIAIKTEFFETSLSSITMFFISISSNGMFLGYPLVSFKMDLKDRLNILQNS